MPSILCAASISCLLFYKAKGLNLFLHLCRRFGHVARFDTWAVGDVARAVVVVVVAQEGALGEAFPARLLGRKQ